jgi:opacity protein-like surface antigen
MKGKKFLISAVFLGLFASSGQAATQEELLQKIEQLSKELEALKAQLREVKEKQATQEEKVSAVDKTVSAIKDGIGKFKIGGDIRVRHDTTRADIKQNAFMLGMAEPFVQMIAGSSFRYISDAFGNNMTSVYQQFEKKTRSHKEDNDSLWTNRLRLDLSVKPTEDTAVKVRLAYQKAWGQTDDYFAPYLFFPMKNNFTLGARPADNTLYVDRAYFNWSNLFGKPIWVSFGRRPTTHGVPQEIREGIDRRDATPTAINIDVPFDGATIGYDWGTGRARFCYGRGFESGFKTPIDRAKDDVEFYGFNIDLYDANNMFLNFQAFKAQDIMDFPNGEMYMFNPAFGMYMPAKFQARTNLGDIYEIGLTWSHKNVKFFNLEGLDYFISLGMSIAEPKAVGQMPMQMYYFNGTNSNPVTIVLQPTLLNMGMTIYNGTLGQNPLPMGLPVEKKTRTGYAVYAGVRFPIPQVYGAKLGLEYNYGSKWWMPFHIGSDDPYMNKLSTRGHVAEVYWQQDLPVGAKLVKNGRALLRVGFQYYWFDYYGSGNWLETPRKISDIKKWAKSMNPMDQMKAMTMYVPIDTMWNLYGSLELFF